MIFNATAVAGGRNGQAQDSVRLAGAASAVNIAKVAPSTGFDTSGIAVLVVIAHDTSDASKMAVWRYSQAWYRVSDAITLVGSIALDAAVVDTDGGAFTSSSPSIAQSGGALYAHVQAHATRTCDFAAFLAVAEVGK